MLFFLEGKRGPFPRYTGNACAGRGGNTGTRYGRNAKGKMLTITLTNRLELLYRAFGQGKTNVAGSQSWAMIPFDRLVRKPNSESEFPKLKPLLDHQSKLSFSKFIPVGPC